jgi:hypothetical protein
MNYKVIIDEVKLREFIDWLPDLLEHECFYMSLFARKKYCPEIKWIKSDKGQLGRKTCTKETIVQKIRQMECAVGSYTQRGDNMPFPQEALALYISPNPRDMYRATLHGISTLAKLIELQNKNHNPHQEMMSVIQQSCTRKIWSDFDIDVKPEDMGNKAQILEKVDEILGGDKNCRRIMETRGGYHVLVSPEKVPESVRRTFYKNLAAIADVKGDTLVPVPGCVQGTLDGELFIPRFID